MAGDSCVTQLITRDGIFCVEGLRNFVKNVKLHQCGLSYAVVAIMGPQSSGKSTLLNHLFYTNFKEMEANKGRFQTTKGVWIAKAIEIEPLTIVMDLEGSDGRERGEDDTTFEKQSTLFALAVADIVLINIWCHDIGREHAANRPLLKIVFQVMMRLFSPRRTTLLFVIRDKTKTPFELLEPILREDIQKIWEAVSKPDAYKDASLSDFFNVEVTALSSYEDKEEQFKEQVAQLRQQFYHSISPGGLAGDRQGIIPGSGFSVSVEQIWKIIKENKDLDLPAHKIMVATVRCEEIANEKYNNLASDKDWHALERNVQSGTILGFGRSLSSILGKYLSEYDLESIYFEEGVRNAKREYLESKALQLVHPTYITALGHLRSKAVESFKTQLENRLHRGHKFADSVRACLETSLLEFDRGCTDAAIEQANWDSDVLKVREKLQHDIEAHSSFVRSHKLSELVVTYERQLSLALSEPLGTLFEAGGSDTWASIRNVLKHQSDKIVSDFSSDISDFELSKHSVDNMVCNLREYARKLVENKAREEAGKVLIRMKDRFATVFNHDKDSMPRVWTGKENIKAITKEAYADSLKLLSTMAVIRLDDRADNVESVLFSNLIDETVPLQNKGVGISADPLTSSQWKEVPTEKTLITPLQCKKLWRQFKAETEYKVAQAIAAREAYKRGKSWLPPPWAIVAMIVLGFNEFMLLLRNPHYILVLFITFFIGKAIWDQFDFPRELENGFLSLSGLISSSSKLFDVLMNIMQRIFGESYENSSTRHERFGNQTQKSESIAGSMLESSGSSSATTETVCDCSSSS